MAQRISRAQVTEEKGTFDVMTENLSFSQIRCEFFHLSVVVIRQC